MFRSKDRKKIERKVRIKKSKMVVQNYINKLEILQKRVYNQGKEYANIGDNNSIRKQASKYLALQNKIQSAKKMLLLMEEADIQTELVSVSNSFIEFSRDLIGSIADAPSIEKLSKANVNFEKAISNIERVEETLNAVIDASSEGILSAGMFDDEKVEEVSKIMKNEAELEEVSDKEINNKLKKIEDMMKDS